MFNQKLKWLFKPKEKKLPSMLSNQTEEIDQQGWRQGAIDFADPAGHRMASSQRLLSILLLFPNIW